MRSRSGTIAPSKAQIIRDLIVRVLIFSLIWWTLTGGRLPLSGLGMIGVGLATAMSWRMIPVGVWQWRLWPLLRFGPYFLRQSFWGGLDVAWRAMRPRMDVEPVVIQYRLRLKLEPARVFFLWMVSLFPGTAGVDLRKDEAWVHVLDESFADQEKLRELEERIADVFGVGVMDG